MRGDQALTTNSQLSTLNSRIPKGYKQTEVGMIPENWEATNLGSFVLLQRGHDLTHRDRMRGDIPVMGSAGQNGFHDTALVKGPGIVVGRSGASFGQAHYCEKDFWPHNTALYVTDFLGNDRRYAFYFLRSIDFSRHNTGGAQQSLNRNFIAPIPIAVPPIAEQNLIARALSDTDALLESLEQLLAKKRQIKQGAMQELLTGKRRVQGFGERKKYNQTELGIIPEDWSVERIGDFCMCFSGGTPNTSNHSYYGGNIAWITSSDLNEVRIKNVKGRISTEGLVNSSAKMVEEGTLLIALYGATAGVSAITEISGAINQAILAIKTVDRRTEYLFQYLRLKKDFYITTYTQGGQPNFSGEIVKGFLVSLPPSLEEQTAIATILSDMDLEIGAIETKLTKARQLKQGMMHELLTGRIRLIERAPS